MKFQWNKLDWRQSFHQKSVSLRFGGKIKSGLCSSRAQSPLALNFCSWATRKSHNFHTNHLPGTLGFTGSEHCRGSLQFSLEHSLESAKIADCTDEYKQHPTLFDFPVIVSKNVSISGNLSCVFKLSKSDGCPFLLKSFKKLKYKRWAYNHSLYGDCL